ncbi:hypothetical protein JYB64_20830 [Algoriphagus aestuarii]|nr:hypothetical protein [Algoriphagus aestuarii]
MKYLKNIIPALALVLGASLAMAMNFAENPTVRYAEDPDSGTEIWYDLTGVTPGGSTYQCNMSPSKICSHEEDDFSSPQVEAGEFVKNGTLPLATP